MYLVGDNHRGMGFFWGILKYLKCVSNEHRIPHGLLDACVLWREMERGFVFVWFCWTFATAQISTKSRS